MYIWKWREAILDDGTKTLRGDALYFITMIINSKTKTHSTQYEGCVKRNVIYSTTTVSRYLN